MIEDRLISAHHCRIERKGSRWVIRDQGSLNGTFVNGGEVLHGQCFGLPRLAEIEVGEERLLFDALGSAQDLEESDTRWVFGMVAESDAMRHVIRDMTNLSKFGPNEPVLILAESGCGKDLLAKALHAQSPRAAKSFLRVNCSSFSPNLVESELFGHMKGAFTGSAKDTPGLFEAMDGGTLFLDEIGDLPLEMQPKILHALEDSVIRRVGGRTDIKVNTRVIAATNKNLIDLASRGLFREDLLHRFILRMHIPPLRERREDILPLVRHFLRRHAGRRSIGLLPDAQEVLRSHRWSGNAREVRNVVVRALMNADGRDQISAKEIRAAIESYSSGCFGRPSDREDDVDDRRKLLEALEHNQWNITKTARDLDVHKDTIYRRMDRFGIERKEKPRLRDVSRGSA